MGPYSQQAKLATYRSVSAHGAVADADPHALVLTVMDAAVARIGAARACVERKETRRMASLLHSAVILIAELRGSLDLQKGAALAQNLSDLYEYMTRRLMLANLNSDPAPMTEVLSLLGEIRGAWAAIGPQVRQQPPSAVTTSA
ncbi:MAG TPA: flagellar export chaperone FliS [Steroidobacteraceae bacterium]|nr:flagellar export chaperone FliS [Steroidobacteraceae bacterium]